MATVERCFPLDHAAAQGHFPGNPIIPGAVLLSETLRAIEAGFGGSLWPGQIKSAKFIHPVRPGDRVLIEYSGRDKNSIRFSCKVGGRAVLAGEVLCETSKIG